MALYYPNQALHVFPTSVGMNRIPASILLPFLCVPHKRGDEPGSFPALCGELGVFPTSVGMNRLDVPALNMANRVPHKRGDEPPSQTLHLTPLMCSPQAWG